MHNNIMHFTLLASLPPDSVLRTYSGKVTTYVSTQCSVIAVSLSSTQWVHGPVVDSPELLVAMRVGIVDH